MKYSKILMTHDGSELADAAIAHASGIASAMRAEVLVLRVTETVGQQLADFGPGTWAGGTTVADVAVQEVARRDAEAQRRLDAIKVTLEQADVPTVTTMIVESYAGPAIVEVATSEHCDLIVMATHGRSGLQRAVVGSVADHVVHHAQCPVLLCRPAAEHD